MHLSLSTKSGLLLCLLIAPFGISETLDSGTKKRLVSLRKRRVRKSRHVLVTASTKAPSSVPSSAPSPVCEDSEDGKFFWKLNKKMKPMFKTCDWLEDKPDLQDKLCAKDGTEHGSPAKEVCPETCGECTSGPTDPPVCEDSEDGKFFWKYNPKNNKPMFKTCGWLEEKPALQDGICAKDETVNGKGPAKEVCPETCGECPEGPSTPEPTGGGTPEPSESECEDSEDGKFFWKYNPKNNKPMFKTCGWLEEKPGLQDDICAKDETVNGKGPAKEVCPETCGECTEGPSTPEPTDGGTPEPSESECEDSEDGKFFWKYNPKNNKPMFKTCGWLEEKPGLQDDICAKDETVNGKGPAKEVCPETCGECS